MLKRDLRIAHLSYTSIQYINKNLKLAALYSFFFTALFFFVLQKAKLSVFLLLPAFIVLFIVIFEYSLLSVKSKIKKREREINKEVLFIGRYLLVKLYSGRPLLNALIETSSSRGIASKYIKEIVDDIGTGSTIEDALNNAMIYSPSAKLGRILFHINNALQLGINVTKPLESVLEEITREEELEIRKYGKKLNTLVIFYMLAAVILPSLGVAMLIVVSSFINFPIDLSALLAFLFFVVVLQFVFITLFKSIRPMVNL
ncbi:type II secretion system F family protein [Candidatus Woesearchaeota archaeon]|nr:type II secretion system F family protein [Candidatus Woesearchaeota archaeon]